MVLLGTTLIIGDPASVEILYSSIPGAKNASSALGPGYYTVPCNSVPTVGFMLADQAMDRNFNVAPSIFNLGPLEGTNDCVGGVISQEDIRELTFLPCINQIETIPCLAFWVLGDVFLRVSKLFPRFDGLYDRVCTEFLHRFRPSKRSCWFRYPHMSFRCTYCDGIVSNQTNKFDSSERRGVLQQQRRQILIFSKGEKVSFWARCRHWSRRTRQDTVRESR
jgi:hypothetical protein